MESLVRSKVGRFEIANSLTLKQIEELRDKGEISFVYTVESMFMHLPAVVVPEGLDKALYNGNSIRYKRELQDAQEVRMYTSASEFIGIFRYEQEKKLFHIVKMFYER